MSNKNPSLAAGLVALGLLAAATRDVAAQDRPEAADAPAPSSPTVLLLSNGRVLRGQVAEDATGYALKTKLGTIRYRRREVEGAFATIEAVYDYKRAHTPERDPDERLKLARWCLEQDLPEQAREQLDAVLQLAPEHAEARAMMGNLAAAFERKQARDEGVVQTSATAPGPIAQGAPGELNLKDLRNAWRQNHGPKVPVIEGLPTPLAVRRSREFALYVHPQLQRYCAACHHEQSGLDFQLVRARSRADLNNDLICLTNLDATLRLIDRQDPARSPLLVSAITDHKPTGRPILSGPNHPAYRAFSTWASSLGPLPDLASPETAPAGFAAPADAAASPAPASGGFGAEHAGGPVPRSAIATPTLPPAPANPNLRLQQGHREAFAGPGAQAATFPNPNPVANLRGQVAAQNAPGAAPRSVAAAPASPTGAPAAPAPPTGAPTAQPGAPADPGQETPAAPTADASTKYITDPTTGEQIPLMTRAAQLKEPEDPKGSAAKSKVPNAALQRFLSGRKTPR